MQNKPLLSIIFPTCYTGANSHSIDATIDSITNEGYQNIEIVILTNATEGTNTICSDIDLSKYATLPQITIIAEKFKNVAEAKNRGLEHTISRNSDFVAFIKPGDTISKGSYFSAIIKSGYNDNMFDIIELGTTKDYDLDSAYTTPNDGLAHFHNENLYILQEFALENISHDLYNKIFKREAINECRFDINYANNDSIFLANITRDAQTLYQSNVGNYNLHSSNNVTTKEQSYNELLSYAKSISLILERLETLDAKARKKDKIKRNTYTIVKHKSKHLTKDEQEEILRIAIPSFASRLKYAIKDFAKSPSKRRKIERLLDSKAESRIPVSRGSDQNECISIIIPIYNVESMLDECLFSIANQTYSNLEIICINDGSTDDSLEVVKRYQERDSRFKVVDKKNEGVATARNAGLKLATSKWITFVDPDDFIELRAYELIAQELSDDIDLLWFGTNLLFDNGDKTLNSERFASQLSSSFNIPYNGLRKFDKEHMMYDPHLWNKVFKRDIIDRHNLTFPDGHIVEDKAFFWRFLFETQNIYYLQKPLYYYRLRSGSYISNIYNNKINIGVDQLCAATLIYEHINKQNTKDLHIADFATLFANGFKYAYNNLPDEQKDELVEQYITALNTFQFEEKLSKHHFIIEQLERGGYNPDLTPPRRERWLSKKLSCTFSLTYENTESERVKVLRIFSIKIWHKIMPQK